MLVIIALTAATVGLCTAPACTKRLDETQWPETRDETYTGPRPRHIAPRPRRDVEDFVRGETEMRRSYVSRPSRPRPHLCQFRYDIDIDIDIDILK